MTVPVPRSLLRSATVRLTASLALAMLTFAAVAGWFYNTALHEAAEYEEGSVRAFYEKKIAEWESAWEREALQHKARLEYSRILEQARGRRDRLYSYQTVQGGQQTFSHMLIATSDGEVIFRYGAAAELLPRRLGEAAPWLFVPADGTLYRSYVQPIWLGAEGVMGRMVLLRRLDNALLFQNADAKTRLSLLWRGQSVVTSYDDAAGAMTGSGRAFAIRQVRVSWPGDAVAAPVLLIEHATASPVSLSDLALGGMLALVTFLAFQWSVLGLWMLRLTRRITALGKASGEFVHGYVISDALQDNLARAASGGEDEVSQVARSLGKLTETVMQREQSQLRAEQAVRESEARIREITAVLGTGVFVVDADGLVTFMNPAAERMLGWSAAELMGKGSHQAFHYVKDDGSPYPESECPVHQTIHRGGSQHRDRDHLIRRDGTLLPVSLSSEPILRDGRPAGSVVSFDDISARLAAEEALRRLNEELEARVAARTRELSDVNARLRREQDELHVLVDKLEQAHHQLLQAEKMASIGQLAAGVAHEINNPIGFVNSNLGTLRGYIDGLLDVLAQYERCEAGMAGADLEALRALKERIDLGFLREDTRSLVAESLDGIRRVKEIVQSLKDFAHVDEGNWQSIDLRQGLESTLKVVWNEIKYKAEVVKDYGDMQPVECNASQINQVFMNLLVNAAQAIDARGVITLRTGMADGGAWVEVADTGCGVAPENLTRIFDPFFTTKPVGKGTGLGLSVSYGIVQQHHGRIDVTSEVGKGSTFRVWLPAVQPGE